MEEGSTAGSGPRPDHRRARRAARGRPGGAAAAAAGSRRPRRCRPRGARRRSTCRRRRAPSPTTWPAVIASIRARAPELRITLDPVEFRGLRYHVGVAFTLYGPGATGELARGGRYRWGNDEPATGMSLYPDAVQRAAPVPPPMPRVFIPLGTPEAALAAAPRPRLRQRLRAICGRRAADAALHACFPGRHGRPPEPRGIGPWPMSP